MQTQSSGRVTESVGTVAGESCPQAQQSQSEPWESAKLCRNGAAHLKRLASHPSWYETSELDVCLWSHPHLSLSVSLPLSLPLPLLFSPSPSSLASSQQFEGL